MKNKKLKRVSRKIFGVLSYIIFFLLIYSMSLNILSAILKAFNVDYKLWFTTIGVILIPILVVIEYLVYRPLYPRFLRLIKQDADYFKALEIAIAMINSDNQLTEKEKRRFIQKLKSDEKLDIAYAYTTLEAPYFYYSIEPKSGSTKGDYERYVAWYKLSRHKYTFVNLLPF